MKSAALAFAIIAGAAVTSAPARADGFPPYYGYSTYFGGPVTYFTHEPDVQQATAFRNGVPTTRTYYRGGPFYGYRPNAPERFHVGRHGRRKVVRARG